MLQFVFTYLLIGIIVYLVSMTISTFVVTKATSMTIKQCLTYVSSMLRSNGWLSFVAQVLYIVAWPIGLILFSKGLVLFVKNKDASID